MQLLTTIVSVAAVASACDKIFITVIDQGVYRLVSAQVVDDKYDPHINGDSGNKGIGTTKFHFGGRDGAFLDFDFSNHGVCVYGRLGFTSTYNMDCKLTSSCHRGPYCAHYECTHFNNC